MRRIFVHGTADQPWPIHPVTYDEIAKALTPDPTKQAKWARALEKAVADICDAREGK